MMMMMRISSIMESRKNNNQILMMTAKIIIIEGENRKRITITLKRKGVEEHEEIKLLWRMRKSMMKTTNKKRKNIQG
jgi:hypothetical protein